MYIAGKIVKKCEKSSRDWRKGAGGGRTMKIEQSDYDACGKTELVEEILALEKAGLLSVKKWAIRGSDVDTIAYRIEDVPKFYEVLAAGRAEKSTQKFLTKQEKVDFYIKLIGNELAAGIYADWLRDYYDYLLSRFEKGSFPKETDQLEVYVKCFRGIDEMLKTGTVMYKRVFSKKYLGNSKTFEKSAETHVISTVRKYWREIEEDMDDKTVLEQLLIREYAPELEIKGPLRIEIEEEASGIRTCVNMGDFIYGSVLNSATLENSRILSEQPEIQRVITIENKANFVSAPYDEHTLYIFSHGYLSPKERMFLIRLREILERSEKQVEYLHSGDLDYGGIKIFEYEKKRIFPELRPYQMDAETFDRYKGYAEPIGMETLEKIKNLDVPEFRELIQRILKSGKVIEQESFLI